MGSLAVSGSKAGRLSALASSSTTARLKAASWAMPSKLMRSAVSVGRWYSPWMPVKKKKVGIFAWEKLMWSEPPTLAPTSALMAKPWGASFLAASTADFGAPRPPIISLGARGSRRPTMSKLSMNFTDSRGWVGCCTQ